MLFKTPVTEIGIITDGKSIAFRDIGILHNQIVLEYLMYISKSNSSDKKFKDSLNDYVSSSLQSKTQVDKEKLLKYFSDFELPVLKMKNLYDDSNFDFGNIDDTEKEYLKKIDDLINKELSIQNTFQELEKLNTSLNEDKLSKEQNALIKSSIATAGYSNALWQNCRKAIELSSDNGDIDMTWGSVIGADVGGAVGGAIYAVGVNVIPGLGQAAYGTSIIGGAVISSCSSLFSDWFLSVPVHEDPEAILNTTVDEITHRLELNIKEFDDILQQYNPSSTFRSGLEKEVSKTVEIINE